MEKLINLLDEYDHKKTEDLERWKQRVDNQKLWIISKQFWFISRLVNKDKINREEIKYSNLYIPLTENFNKDERLIMLLSISDTPIKDLILYLK